MFGGIPRHWERFHQEQAALPQPEAGFPAWREAFLVREIDRLTADPTERWDWKGWVEIEPVTRSILETIVSRNFRGTPRSLVAETCRPADADGYRWPDDFRHHLVILEAHLQLAAPVSKPDRLLFLPPNVEKIRVIDATTLFQLLALDSPEAPVDAAEDPKLLVAEGYALERLTAEWMEALPEYERVAANVQPGTIEIDVLGLSARKPVNAEWMTFCSCKRSPARHNPVREAKRIQAFLGEIETREGWARPRDENVVKALVSPHVRRCGQGTAGGLRFQAGRPSEDGTQAGVRSGIPGRSGLRASAPGPGFQLRPMMPFWRFSAAGGQNCRRFDLQARGYFGSNPCPLPYCLDCSDHSAGLGCPAVPELFHLTVRGVGWSDIFKGISGYSGCHNAAERSKIF